MAKNYYLYGATGKLAVKLYLIGSYSNKISMMIDKRKWEKVGFDSLMVSAEEIEGAEVLKR